MAYKNPKDPEVLQKRVEMDYAYMNTERGFVISCIARKFKPSIEKYGGHRAHESMDKKEFWRLYMNHIINMKEKFPDSDGRLCRYCEHPFTFETRMGTRGKGQPSNRATQNYNNFSIDRSQVMRGFFSRILCSCNILSSLFHGADMVRRGRLGFPQ